MCDMLIGKSDDATPCHIMAGILQYANLHFFVNVANSIGVPNLRIC